jgi:diguanylate cyclase (GGDEF)-like protein
LHYVERIGGPSVAAAGWVPVESDQDRAVSRRDAVVAAAAAAMFAIVFVLRLEAGTDDPVLLLAAVPVAVLAVELGIVAGIIGAGVALAMMFAWLLIDDVSLSFADWAWRIAAFPIIAALLAEFGSRLREMTATGGQSHQQLVETQRELRDHVDDLASIVEATRELARSTDAASARHAICDATREVSGAQVAILFQPDPTGVGLRVTAAKGAPGIEDLLLPFVGPPSGAVRAFTTGEPFFVADVVGHPAVIQAVVENTGAVSVLWQPVLRGDSSIGVLTAVWQHRVDAVSDRLAPVMGLLAAEAAVAIERADMLGRLESMARTDDLTGLPNRRSWFEELPRELARAQRYEHPVCVAMLDLDRFKDYNDRHGHLAGDRLLKEAAGAWREALRETDRLARYGGEEFSLVLPDCTLEDAVQLVERLRAVTPGGETCSAGVAEWNGDETPESLVRRADAALYEAKRIGRDRVIVASKVSRP